MTEEKEILERAILKLDQAAEDGATNIAILSAYEAQAVLDQLARLHWAETTIRDVIRRLDSMSGVSGVVRTLQSVFDD